MFQTCFRCISGVQSHPNIPQALLRQIWTAELPEAKKFYENCYAWSFWHDFVSWMLQQNVKISDTELQNVCHARYGDSVETFLWKLFFFHRAWCVRWKKSFHKIVFTESLYLVSNVLCFSVWDFDILIQHTPYKIIAKWPSVSLFIGFLSFTHQMSWSMVWSTFGGLQTPGMHRKHVWDMNYWWQTC